MKSSYNNKTFYIGTPKKLEECALIYFFKTQNLSPTYALGLDKLDKLKEDIERETLELALKKDDGMYYKTLGESYDHFEFDLIVYCTSPLGTDVNSIVGYTKFSELQRTYTLSGNTFGELIIQVTFSSNGSSSSDVSVSILNTWLATQSELDLRGEESYHYPTLSGDNFKKPEINYVKYSNRVSDVKTDKTLGALTDSGLIFHNEEGNLTYTNMFFPQKIFLDKESFNHFELGVFGDDIVICGFNKDDGNYSVSSLTRVNKFGRPYDYLSGYLDMAVVEDKTRYEYLYYSGSSIVFWDKGIVGEGLTIEPEGYVIFYLEEKDVWEKRRSGYADRREYLVLDIRDPEGKKRMLTSNELFREITNTCITPSSFKQTQNLYRYSRKIGSWWELIRGNEGEEAYFYLSPYGLVQSQEELSLINDRIFKSRNNTFFAIEFGHIYEYYNDLVHDLSELESSGDIGIHINTSQSWEGLSPEKECFLDGLRRKPIRSKYCYPSNDKVLGSLFGLVFYRETDIKTKETFLYCY